MKSTTSLSFLIMGLFPLLLFADTTTFPQIDRSPVDLLYYPSNAPSLGTTPTIRVLYSRPSKRDRIVFGGLVPYDILWRTGANESTEIRFYQAVTISGIRIPAGIYSLYSIPSKDKWIVIINSDTDRWGDTLYDSAKDLIRMKVSSTVLESAVEYLSMAFVPQNNGVSLVIAWENTQVEIPIQLD